MINMHTVKKTELLKALESYPLFTFNDFVRITGKSSEYARVMLFRLRKEKLVYQIEKGKYSLHDDPPPGNGGVSEFLAAHQGI